MDDGSTFFVVILGLTLFGFPALTIWAMCRSPKEVTVHVRDGAKTAAPPPRDPKLVRIAELEAQVSALSAAAASYSDTGAALKQRLAAAQVAAQKSSQGCSDDKFRQLRELVMKELHPDNAPPGMDRVVREEVFKAIWPKIEAMTQP
jgi:hypothetical protein